MVVFDSAIALFTIVNAVGNTVMECQELDSMVFPLP